MAPIITANVIGIKNEVVYTIVYTIEDVSILKITIKVKYSQKDYFLNFYYLRTWPSG